jgi:hypothetical protein
MKNKLIISTLVLVFFLSTFWINSSSTNQPSSISKQEFNNLKAELEKLKLILSNNVVGKFEQTNSQLQKIKLEQQKLAALSGPLPGVTNEYDVSGIIDSSQTVKQIALQEKIAMEEEAIKTEAKVDHLKTELDQENIDEEWGPEIEQTLSDKFGENAPEGSSLLETDCRSTFCRITIANNADTEFNPREILGDLFTNSEGFYNKSVDSNGKQITELYVSRNGYNLPAIDTENSM